MLRSLALGVFLATPLAAAQTPLPTPLPEAPRSVELSGFSFDAPDAWRIVRSQQGDRPMAMLQPVPLGGPEVSALVISIPQWTDALEAGAFVAESYELRPLDDDWLTPTAGLAAPIDSAVVRAFTAPPEAPAATAAVLAVQMRGRVAVVFLSTEQTWEAERLRDTAAIVASGFRRDAPTSAD